MNPDLLPTIPAPAPDLSALNEGVAALWHVIVGSARRPPQTHRKDSPHGIASKQQTP
jgi:hypothetical protein